MHRWLDLMCNNEHKSNNIPLFIDLAELTPTPVFDNFSIQTNGDFVKDCNERQQMNKYYQTQPIWRFTTTPWALFINWD